MQEAKEPVSLFISFCPVCGTRLICGEAVKKGLQQCARCKNFWVIEISEGDVHVKQAPKGYRRMIAL